MKSDGTVSVRISGRGMDVLRAMRGRTGQPFRYLVDDLIEDRRRIRTVQAEMDRALLDAGGTGDKATVDLIRGFLKVLGKPTG